MNRQFNYIVAAFLLLLTLAGSVFFIQKIADTPAARDDHYYIIDEENKASEPVLSGDIALGNAIFSSKCAPCHNIFKDSQGPAFTGFQERGKWADRNELYKWIKNPAQYIKTSEYARELKERFGSIMPPFPELSSKEIDAIVAYINDNTMKSRAEPTYASAL